MMGVGKSTIGKSLANKLSFNFIDVDKVIEEKEGSSIDVIFKNKSENYFRSLESKITLIELKNVNLLFLLVEVHFLNRSIRHAVRKSSISFWLDINTSLLIKRLENQKKTLF